MFDVAWPLATILGIDPSRGAKKIGRIPLRGRTVYEISERALGEFLVKSCDL